MKKNLISLLAVLSLAVPAAAVACEGDHQAAAPAEPKKVTIAELAKLQEKKAVTAVDANGAEFRTKNGVIPGAILLTSSSSFDTTKELPADKASSLVFYCANTKCSASEAAAKKAAQAGYTNVAILPDGLMGWKAAGQKTAQPKPNS